jgi:hypothetical protein
VIIESHQLSVSVVFSIHDEAVYLRPTLPVVLGVWQGQFGNALIALDTGCIRLVYLGFFVLR